ncbi:MAG: hypothetical protein LBC42_03610 [Puniceicoccales bacterium]|jgi:hypothetical protein|nr:hypothetical protein [Puniceicoccales bacterium]
MAGNLILLHFQKPETAQGYGAGAARLVLGNARVDNQHVSAADLRLRFNTKPDEKKKILWAFYGLNRWPCFFMRILSWFGWRVDAVRRAIERLQEQPPVEGAPPAVAVAPLPASSARTRNWGIVTARPAADGGLLIQCGGDSITCRDLASLEVMAGVRELRWEGREQEFPLILLAKFPNLLKLYNPLVLGGRGVRKVSFDGIAAACKNRRLKVIIDQTGNSLNLGPINLRNPNLSIKLIEQTVCGFKIPASSNMTSIKFFRCHLPLLSKEDITATAYEDISGLVINGHFRCKAMPLCQFFNCHNMHDCHISIDARQYKGEHYDCDKLEIVPSYESVYIAEGIPLSDGSSDSASVKEIHLRGKVHYGIIVSHPTLESLILDHAMEYPINIKKCANDITVSAQEQGVALVFRQKSGIRKVTIGRGVSRLSFMSPLDGTTIAIDEELGKCPCRDKLKIRICNSPIRKNFILSTPVPIQLYINDRLMQYAQHKQTKEWCTFPRDEMIAGDYEPGQLPQDDIPVRVFISR